MCEVRAVIYRQRTVVDRWNGVRVNKTSSNQVVDEQKEQHCDGRCEGVQASVGFMQCFISKAVQGVLCPI